MDVAVFTLGCKTNLYESGQIVAELNHAGHNAFHGLKRADVFVLNTCAITQEAEKKSRQLISRAKKLNPDCRIIVVGCASEKNSEQFLKNESVTFVKGAHGKQKVASEIDRLGAEIEDAPRFFFEGVHAMQERSRAFVKIQDGCDNFCSYCIVPYLRGRSRSRKISEIVAEVNSAARPETVLIGIDISQFGADNKETLTELFDALKDSPTRLRLGSLEESAVNGKLLSSLKNCDFCPHFHLSLQSGSNSVLKRMNRKYTAENYEEAVKNIRKVFPDAALTTDIIVGFCGETEEEFAQTQAFARRIGFADIHIFPYSEREGTAAYGKDNVPASSKTERAARLSLLKADFKKAFAEKFVGKTVSVLAECRRGGYWEGYSKEYLRVYFEGDCKEGKVVNVKITAPYLDGASGEII